MSTLVELRALVKAKNEKLPKGKKFNAFGKSRVAIEQFLGVASSATVKAPRASKAKASTAKAAKTQSKKFETSKTSSAIAHAIAKKTGGDAKAIHESLKKKLQAAIDKKRRQMRKEGKEPTPKDLRAAAVLVIKQSAREALKGKVASEEKSKRTGAKVAVKALALGKASNPNVPIGDFSKTRLDQQKAIIEKEFKSRTPKLEEGFKKALDSAEIYMRTTPESLDKIIGSGRVKNFFEVGKTDGGSEDVDHKKKQENKTFGIPLNSPAKNRPNYAYLAEPTSEGVSTAHGGLNHLAKRTGRAIDEYGDVAVQLKKTVKDRSTFTPHDSIQGIYPASSVSKPEVAAAFSGFTGTSAVSKKQRKKTADAIETGKLGDIVKAQKGDYYEAQIHGGIQTSDIAGLHFLRGSQPSQEVRQWAKKNGVKITTHKQTK